MWLFNRCVQCIFELGSKKMRWENCAFIKSMQCVRMQKEKKHITEKKPSLHLYTFDKKGMNDTHERIHYIQIIQHSIIYMWETNLSKSNDVEIKFLMGIHQFVHGNRHCWMQQMREKKNARTQYIISISISMYIKKKTQRHEFGEATKT